MLQRRSRDGAEGLALGALLLFARDLSRPPNSRVPRTGGRRGGAKPSGRFCRPPAEDPVLGARRRRR
eukprot:15148982-Alexandrium_andersonii.AAC.1